MWNDMDDETNWGESFDDDEYDVDEYEYSVFLDNFEIGNDACESYRYPALIETTNMTVVWGRAGKTIIIDDEPFASVECESGFFSEYFRMYKIIGGVVILPLAA